MIIPLINPSRRKASKKAVRKPVKKISRALDRSLKDLLAGAYRFYSQEIVRKRSNPKKKAKKRPAIRRGILHPKKERSMVHSLLRPRRKLKARRRSRKARRNPRFGAHRPTLLYTRVGWKRPKRSKLFKKSVRVNPKRSRRYSRYFRRNPALPFQLDKVAMGGLKIAGGIAIGFIAMPVLVKFLPATVTEKYRRFYGLLHVVLGAVAAAFVKKQAVKDIALTVAGTGVYDLIACNVSFLGLPPLPSSTPLLGGPVGQDYDAVGSSYQEAVGLEADMAPALGSSYQEVGADDISYGGDSIELD